MKTSTSPLSEVSSPGHPVPGPPVQTGSGDPLPSKKIKDLRGRTFKWLTVLEFAGLRRPSKKEFSHATWHCRCRCGNEIVTTGHSLLRGDTCSCGCYRIARAKAAAQQKIPNLIGKTFGRLTVIEKTTRQKKRNKATAWRCLCACGKNTVVYTYDLLHRRTLSCGCHSREQARKTASARVGIANPNWNPTLTDEDRERRRLGTGSGAALQAVAKRVRQRDKCHCFVCKQPGRIVHHLEPWAKAPTLRYSPNNLITLCTTCHNQFHKLYGSEGDLDDFEDFIKP